MIFKKIIEQQFNVKVEREYKFHPKRKWRFDYAIPEYKIGIEIDGGIWIGGRHTSGTGFMKDMEKLNHAAMSGWLILRFTPEQKLLSWTLEQIKITIKYRKCQ